MDLRSDWSFMKAGKSYAYLPLAAGGQAEGGAAPRGTRRRHLATAAEIKAQPELCSLCGAWSRGTQLRFMHERDRDRVMLEMHLCRPCGDRIEKHLKRAIPRRAMEVTPLEPDDAAA